MKKFFLFFKKESVAFSQKVCYNNPMKNPEMKTFPFKFSVKIILLCAAILALCVAGVIVSTIRMIRFGIHGLNDVIKYPFLIAVCVACIVIVVSLLIKSQYVVTDKEFITQFGFIKTKYPVKDLTSLLLDREKNKLTIYMGEQFAVVSVDPKWNEDFVRELLKINPDIEYSFTVTENKPQD